MAICDLYAVNATSIEEARAFIEEIGIVLREHNSGYHRGPYFAYGKIGEENFKLKRNIDPYEDVPNEADFPDQQFLLYVNNTPRSPELQELFQGENSRFTLLRHEDL